MNRKIVAILMVAVALMVSAVLVFHFVQAPSQKPTHTRIPYEFNAGTLKVGNTTVDINGGGFFSIQRGNNTSAVYAGFYLNNQYLNITSDVLSLAASDTQAMETIGMPGVQLDIRYELNTNRLVCKFTLNNTGNSSLPLDMIFRMITYNLTYVTVFKGSPYSSTNVTLIPETFGFTETYNIYDVPIYASYWANETNINVNWYSMEGMLKDSVFTFTGSPYDSTEMTLEFSGIAEPAGFSLDAGQISMSF